MAQDDVETIVRGPRIVLGIDYGTTYTGLAWMQTTGHDSPSMGGLKVFRDWPRQSTDKVPSAYSYSKTSAEKRCMQWGDDIDDKSEVMRWTKLELKPRTPVKELEVLRELLKGLDLINNLRSNNDAAYMNDIPRYLPKDAGDIVKDYLGEVARKWFLYMRTNGGRNALASVPLDIILTHPASWPYEALNKTFRAVTGAFHSGLFPTLRNISLTSEPEACALYTVQDMLLRDRNPLIPGECLILCDAGGGTVDVVAYRIESVGPLRLIRVGGVSGGNYGAIFIDHAFMEWLRPRLEDQELLPRNFQLGGHFVMTPVIRILLERFERIKHAFTGEETGDFSLPRGVIVAEDQQEDLASGVISLTKQDIREMFETSVRGTIGLIAKQVIQTENRMDGGSPCKVTNIFLAGGFSENKYLFSEVKKFTDSSGHINLQRAEDCWSGVVKGAVLRGMGIGMDGASTAKRCPRHYGICVSGIYADWKHYDAQTVTIGFQRQIIPNQIIWLIRKGDAILSHEPAISKLSVECKFTTQNVDSAAKMRIVFVACTVDNPPSDLSNLSRDENEVVDLDVNLKLIPESSLRQNRRLGISLNYIADIEVKLEVSKAVQVEIGCDGTSLKKYDTSLGGLVPERSTRHVPGRVERRWG